jgi:hypothetical protein
MLIAIKELTKDNQSLHNSLSTFLRKHDLGIVRKTIFNHSVNGKKSQKLTYVSREDLIFFRDRALETNRYDKQKQYDKRDSLVKLYDEMMLCK